MDYAKLDRPDIDLAEHVIFAIGDVHGCPLQLSLVLDYIRKYETDRTKLVYLLGDLVDRGPDSAEVLSMTFDILAEFPGSKLHLGNHDEVLLMWLDRQAGKDVPMAHTLDQWERGMWGGDKTVNSLQMVPDSRLAKYHAMLRNAADITQVGRYVFCHAGIDWAKPLAQQTTDMVRWSGEPLFNPDQVLPEYKDTILVIGHWCYLDGPVFWDRAVCIDTGAFHQQTLTVAIIDSQRYVPMTFMQTDENHDIKLIGPKNIQNRLDRIMHEAV